LENAFHHFGGRTLHIRVFNAKDELSLVMLREKPVEESGSGATDVEVAGWGGSEADTNLRQRRFSCRKTSPEEQQTAKARRTPRDHWLLVTGYFLFAISADLHSPKE
jgi:hypothetical protein